MANFKRLIKIANKGIKSDVTAIDAVEFRREQYFLNQSEFAEILGMQKSHYSEFINGKRDLPKSAMKRAIAIGIPAISVLS